MAWIGIRIKHPDLYQIEKLDPYQSEKPDPYQKGLDPQHWLENDFVYKILLRMFSMRQKFSTSQKFKCFSLSALILDA